MNSIPQWAELTPSYGRDYSSAAKAKADFLAGKDFTLAATGQQMSITDVDLSITVYLRYAKLTKFTPVTVTMKMLSEARTYRELAQRFPVDSRVHLNADVLGVEAGTRGKVRSTGLNNVVVQFDGLAGPIDVLPGSLSVVRQKGV